MGEAQYRRAENRSNHDAVMMFRVRALLYFGYPQVPDTGRNGRPL